MGAGASVASATTVDNHRNAGRASTRAVSTRSVNSVRAMALKNHSRQENSYIPQDKLRSRLKDSLRSVDSRVNKFHSESHNRKGIEEKIPEQLSEPTLANSCDELPVTEPKTTVGSLIAFKSCMNLNLKITLDDDNDWGRVSDEDEDEVDLTQFDRNLIDVAIPEEQQEYEQRQSNPTLLTSVSTLRPSSISLTLPVSDKKNSVINANNNLRNSAIQYRQDGTLLVDGLKAGVGAEGIIRLDDMNNNNENANNGDLTARSHVKQRLSHLQGSGASSAVYKALDLTDMRLVALKMIHVNDSNKRSQFVRELRALFQLLRDHSRRSSIHMPKKFRRPEKYIVDFYDAFSNMEDGVVSLMIEYMDGGSLQDIVDEGGCDDEPTLANIAVQALKGLLFLHEGLQLHRDLKPANFLISHRGEVKVADLGILKQLGEPSPDSTAGGSGGINSKLPKTATFVGTTTYMSPERIDGKEYGFPADVWAFGLSMITIALGRMPIETQGGYWTILHGIRDAPAPTLPDYFSPECRDFVAQCLKRLPEDRMTVKELLKHPFLKKTVVEDLSYNQSYDRGRNELISIIDAMYDHIKLLRSEGEKKRSSLRPESNRSSSINNSMTSCESNGSSTSRSHTDNYNENNTGYGVKNNNNNTPTSTTTTNPLFERLYGDIYNADPVDTLKLLLFNKASLDSNRSTTTTTVISEDDKRHRIVRPRLNILAKQLHLPIDKVEKEAKMYLESLMLSQ